MRINREFFIPNRNDYYFKERIELVKPLLRSFFSLFLYGCWPHNRNARKFRRTSLEASSDHYEWLLEPDCESRQKNCDEPVSAIGSAVEAEVKFRTKNSDCVEWLMLKLFCIRGFVVEFMAKNLALNPVEGVWKLYLISIAFKNKKL